MQNPTGLTDISNLPLHRVKPQEGKLEQSSSKTSTMQSVSLNEVPAHDDFLSSGIDSIVHEAQELKHNIVKKAYLLRKSITRKFGKKTQVKTTAKRSTKYGIAFPRNREVEMMKGVSKRPFLVRKSVTRKLTKKTQKSEMRSTKYGIAFPRNREVEMMKGVSKRPFLVRKSITRKLTKRSTEKKAGFALKDLKRRARSFGRKFNKGQAKKYQREFQKEADMAGTSLRQGASDLRSKARKLLNTTPSTEISKKSVDAGAAPNKFILEFSSTEWNGKTFKPRTQPSKGQSIESNPSKWSSEISAHEWNESSSLLASQQAGFLMSKAQDFVKRASKQVNWAQRRLGSWAGDFKKGASSLYRGGAKKL